MRGRNDCITLCMTKFSMMLIGLVAARSDVLRYGTAASSVVHSKSQTE